MIDPDPEDLWKWGGIGVCLGPKKLKFKFGSEEQETRSQDKAPHSRSKVKFISIDLLWLNSWIKLLYYD